jgi:hypothetical protein
MGPHCIDNLTKKVCRINIFVKNKLSFRLCQERVLTGVAFFR